LVTLVSEAFLRRFGLDSRERLAEIAEEIGIEVLYRPAESFDGALLRTRDAQRGYIVINSRIREESRRRFTLAHEIGHFVLPGQQEVSAPCKQQRIENWDADLYRPELEANHFAAEILMPRRLMAEFVESEPSLESIRSIAQLCSTSLTASAVRLITLTPHRAAVVWSRTKRSYGRSYPRDLYVGYGKVKSGRTASLPSAIGNSAFPTNWHRFLLRHGRMKKACEKEPRSGNNRWDYRDMERCCHY
jgi:Zn-dependent peptidase ImmA (M78 family)